MELSGPQQKQLQEALVKAFPTHSDLEQMVFHGLSVHLSAITTAGNVRQAVFELLQWAQARGRLEELIQAALLANSGNQELQRVAALLAMKSGQSSSGIPPSSRPRSKKWHQHYSWWAVIVAALSLSFAIYTWIVSPSKVSTASGNFRTPISTVASRPTDVVTPTPTIPHLKESYTGTSCADGSDCYPVRLLINSQNQQGDLQATMVTTPCTGSIAVDRSITLQCQDPQITFTFKGFVYSDGHIEGVETFSDNLTFYDTLR